MMKKALWMWSLAITIVGGLLSAKPALAQELKAGDPAPDFNLPGTDGKTYSLASLKGKAFVLAWFPKAFTGG
jgi:thioredoxin-dependent peroxiredoxin